MTKTERLIVGISGASGVVYGVKLLEVLQSHRVETHLIMSKAAEVTLAHELSLKSRDVHDLANVTYNFNDIAAALSSGSFKTLGMVVAPCSMKSLADIANGTTGNLLTRAADVVLKERRRLVLMARETPLHAGHLKNMLAVTEMGGIIAPPVPAFYANPQNLDEMVHQTIGRVLDLFDIEIDQVTRWRDAD